MMEITTTEVKIMLREVLLPLLVGACKHLQQWYRNGFRRSPLKQLNRATEERARIASAREQTALWVGVAFAVLVGVVLLATAYSSRRLEI